MVQKVWVTASSSPDFLLEVSGERDKIDAEIGALARLCRRELGRMPATSLRALAFPVLNANDQSMRLRERGARVDRRC
jgi:hypothetical protein